MAVIDRINRIGSSGKRVITGPGELVGPKANSDRINFSSVTRITGSVDLYEITDGSGANEGTYTVTVRPVSVNGMRASLGGIGRVALVRQADGVNTPGAAASVMGLRQSRNSTSPVTVGPAAIATNDRLYVVVERNDTSTIKYQLELDRVLDAITIGTQPAAASVTAPAPAQFTVAATTNDGGTLSYQWQLSTNGGTTFTNITNGGVYSTATTATLNISDATGLDGRQYRVVISSTGGAPNATSSAATLTVA